MYTNYHQISANVGTGDATIDFFFVQEGAAPVSIARVIMRLEAAITLGETLASIPGRIRDHDFTPGPAKDGGVDELAALRHKKGD